MGCVRLPGWESRLAAVIEGARSTPYALGEHDCFRVACATIEALTGEDRWPEFAGRYRTAREALRLIARYGSTFEAAFSWLFGCDPQDMKQARRGDICKYVQGEAHLGVCIGASVAVLIASGLAFVPRSECGCCWMIG